MRPSSELIGGFLVRLALAGAAAVGGCAGLGHAGEGRGAGARAEGRGVLAVGSVIGRLIYRVAP